MDLWAPLEPRDPRIDLGPVAHRDLPHDRPALWQRRQPPEKPDPKGPQKHQHLGFYIARTKQQQP